MATTSRRAHGRGDQEVTVPLLFSRLATRRGDSVALVSGDEEYSYRELAIRVEQIASHLRVLGVGPDEPVLVYADRNGSSVASLLAVMKVGGVVIPTSLDTPTIRLAYIIRDTGARFVLADRAGCDRLDMGNCHADVVAADETAARPFRWSRAAGPIKSSDLAYIIYTSGTSGQPKGVMIEHGSLARRYFDWDRAFGLGIEAQRVLQISKLGFDVFVGDVIKALCSGGTLVICSDDEVLDPAQLYRRIVRDEIDYIDVVPAVLRLLVEYLEESGQDLAGVRIVNCGADTWTIAEYERFRRVTKVGRLFNGYGVSECTVESTLFEDDGQALADRTTLPIGRPLASDHVRVVDEAIQPVSPGTTGQLCIGGPCVARGYLNRPELNERFVELDVDGLIERFYLTGDVGRIGSDGLIEFLGRTDSQVKINGCRIEVEEVARVLERAPGVEGAVVCPDGDKRGLLGFVRMSADDSYDPSDLMDYLCQRLPRYMLPKGITCVESFPLTGAGKVDRMALMAEASRSAS